MRCDPRANPTDRPSVCAPTDRTPPPVCGIPRPPTGPPLRSVGLRWALKPRSRPVHYKMTLISSGSEVHSRPRPPRVPSPRTHLVFEDSPGLCRKRPRESVRVPLLARIRPFYGVRYGAVTHGQKGGGVWSWPPEAACSTGGGVWSRPRRRRRRRRPARPRPRPRSHRPHRSRPRARAHPRRR